MDNTQKLELLAEAFDMEAKELAPQMILEQIENWDSMTKLSIVALADSKFGKTISKEIMDSFKSVQDILNFLE